MLKSTLQKIYGASPVQVQNLLCTFDGFRRSRQRFTPHFHERLATWESTVLNSEEWHLENQWAELKRLITFAREKTDFYRFLPEPVWRGDAAESIDQTLKQIQPLEKSVYRARSRDFLPREIRPLQYRRFYTSGTTGSALEVFDTLERLAENYAVVWRQRRSFGVELNDPFLAFTGQVVTPIRQSAPPFWRTDHWTQRTLFSVFHMSPENAAAYVEPIHASPATYVEGYPSALHVVSRAMIDQGRCLPPGRLKAVFTSSESLLDYQRERIEKAFGAPVRDHYASTENVVAMTSCELNRLHVDMEFCIVEVEPVEETDEWVRGSLLVTGIGSCIAPMVRYRIGDVGIKLKRPCECGRPGTAFLDIHGRVEDYVLTPTQRYVGRLDHIFKERFDIAEAQIVQDEISRLEVRVVPSEEFGEDSRARLIRDFKARVGQDMKIDIKIVDRIPREANGKFRAVRSSIARHTL